ncbi:MAG: DUF885 domain-containing protein [Clostridium sp.]|nr:DUF885 domain-containing protein [Clostridium sp.]
MKAKRQYCCFLLAMLLSIMLSSCSRPPAAGTEETGVSLTSPESASETEASQKESSAVSSSEKSVQAAFDAFTRQIFKDELEGSGLTLHYMLKDPENYGISTADPKLGECSLEYLQQVSADMEKLSEELHAFDPSLLTADQLFTYRALDDYLETEQMAKGLELYSRPVSTTIGTQAQLPILFAEYAFYDRQDVEDYLNLMSQIDSYYKSIAEFEKVRADAGLAPCDLVLNQIIQSCKDYMIRPENSFLNETFNSKLDSIEDLTPEEKEEYKKRHLTVMKEHFIPAYQMLAGELEKLKGRGSNSMGLCGYPDGKRYYEYLAASSTGTGYTVPELKQQVQVHMSEDLAQVTLLLQNHPELSEASASYSFAQTEPAAILDALKTQAVKDFPALPEADYTVHQVPKALEASLSPAFYLTAPIDCWQHNVIYINGGSEQTSAEALYTTLAHEGYPGHLYQTVYANQNVKDPLLRLLACGGYTEGWGTYAEIYSYRFDNGLSPELSELLAHNQAATLGLYALLDININYEGWSQERTAKFLEELYGITDGQVVEEIYYAVADNPANYLQYYTGYMEMVKMRETAIETLGERYDPIQFHKFILDMDGASFRVMEPYFKTWLLTCGAQ